MSLNQLPNVRKEEIDAMNRIAEERMKKDGLVMHEPIAEPLQNMHPMLQHHEEPDYYAADESHESEVQTNQDQDYEEEEQEVVQQPVAQESHQQMNFRMIRERAEAAERRADEAMKYAMSLQQQNTPKQQVQVVEDDYSDIGLDDDGLAEGKHLKKVLKEMRELKREMHEYKTRSTNDTVEVKLKSQYPDFDNVITKENLETLSSMNPDLADMISNTPDMYKRAKLAYDMVKQFGIYKSGPPAKTYSAEKHIAQKNAAKPRPLTSVSPQQGDTPLSKANAFANGGLSEEMKAQYRREMAHYAKGR